MKMIILLAAISTVLEMKNYVEEAATPAKAFSFTYRFKQEGRNAFVLLRNSRGESLKIEVWNRREDTVKVRIRPYKREEMGCLLSEEAHFVPRNNPYYFLISMKQEYLLAIEKDTITLRENSVYFLVDIYNMEVVIKNILSERKKMHTHDILQLIQEIE